MHDDDSPRRDASRHREEEKIERAVLAYVLARYPDLVTLKELIDEIAGPQGDQAERGAVHRAVAELIAVGLLHHFGEALLPSRAALHFDALGL